MQKKERNFYRSLFTLEDPLEKRQFSTKQFKLLSSYTSQSLIVTHFTIL